MLDSQAISRPLNGLIEYQQALDEVLTYARHQVRVFDYDLHEGGWNSPARFERLSQFLLGRECKLHVVLHSTDFVARYCPRLLALLRQYTDKVAIHQTTTEARGASDPLLIVDDAFYVHRFHYEQPRAELALHAVAHAGVLIRRFDEIWQASMPAVTATVLGL
jgi:hypothetical protein